jgi:hypothetical protein
VHNLAHRLLVAGVAAALPATVVALSASATAETSHWRYPSVPRSSSGPAPAETPAFGFAPAAVSWGTGRLDAFYRGATGGPLRHTWSTNGGTSWPANPENLGGIIRGEPGVTSQTAGRLDVFVRGDNDLLYTKYYQRAWSGYHLLPSVGTLAGSAPAAATWSPGRLDVFYRLADGSLGQSWWNGDWHAARVPGLLNLDPVVATWAPGRLDVFFQRQGDAALGHSWWNGHVWRTESLGGVLAGQPAVVAPEPGTLLVYVRGTNQRLYVKVHSGGWSGFIPVADGVASDPAAAMRLDNRVADAVAGLTDRRLVYVDLSAEGDVEQGVVPGVLSSVPGATSARAGQLDVFYQGTSGNFVYRRFDGNTWTDESIIGTDYS